MSCQKCLKLLDDYVDEELELNSRNFVDQHLKECDSCFEEYQKSLRLKSILKATITKMPSEEYFDETTAIINARTVGNQVEITSVKSRKKVKSDFYRSLVSLAASIILFASAVFIGTSKDTTYFSATQPDSPVLAMVPFDNDFFEYKNIILTKSERIDQLKGMLALSPPGLLSKSSILLELDNLSK